MSGNVDDGKDKLIKLLENDFVMNDLGVEKR